MICKTVKMTTNSAECLLDHTVHYLCTTRKLPRRQLQRRKQLVGSHAAPPPFETVFPHLYALRTADSLVLGRSSRLMFARHFVAGPLSAPLIPLPGLSSVINSLLTYEELTQ